VLPRGLEQERLGVQARLLPLRLLREHLLLRGLEHAVEAPEHRERQDHLAVLGLLVVAPEKVGDAPDERGEVRFGHGADRGRAYSDVDMDGARSGRAPARIHAASWGCRTPRFGPPFRCRQLWFPRMAAGRRDALRSRVLPARSESRRGGGIGPRQAAYLGGETDRQPLVARRAKPPSRRPVASTVPSGTVPPAPRSCSPPPGARPPAPSALPPAPGSHEPGRPTCGRPRRLRVPCPAAPGHARARTARPRWAVPPALDTYPRAGRSRHATARVARGRGARASTLGYSFLKPGVGTFTGFGGTNPSPLAHATDDCTVCSDPPQQRRLVAPRRLPHRG
jgi:hypothetical protein